MPTTNKYLEKRDEAATDTECYIDYWSIGFKNLATGKKVIIEKYDGLDLDRAKIKRIMRKFRLYSFNGLGYDMPMIALAMAGASNKRLKEASDDLIANRLPVWRFWEKYGVELPEWLDHIDIMEVAPGVRLSLKKYGARMNMKRLQELPIDPSEPVGAHRRPLMRVYLGNDLDTTAELALGLREEIDIRNEISAEYNIDVRSKSDAQIAEALIKAEVERVTGRKIEKPVVKTFSFKYEAPDFIKFKTPLLQEVLEVVTSTRFFVSGEPDPIGAKKKNFGVVRLPQAIKDLKIRIGFTDYKMGIGGLHSKEKRRSYIAGDDTIIEDRDVRAYYPRLMLACGYVPAALGQNFLGVFSKFVNLRDSYKIKAAKLKKLGDAGGSLKYKKRSDSFKIVNNGTFGKTGSPYSVVYAPKLMISTTITGQLSLLMLIEELELNGFTVISANTDGIVTVIERDRYWLFNAIVFEWECATSFQTEAVRYLGVYSRDVNSYVAVVEDAKKPGQVAMIEDKAAGTMVPEVKRKGLFAKAGLQAKHDPTFDICSTAVVEYLIHGTDIEDTITGCTDITQFIGVKQVGKVKLGNGKMAEGGYDVHGNYLGKMVRWYYGEGERGFIAKANGARVAGTTGAVPCMDLPDELPDDIDYRWYVREAYARLNDIGLTVKNPRLAGRQGYVPAILPGQKTAHIIDLQTMQALCGREEKNVREPWEELNVIQDHIRVCRKCQDERALPDDEEDED
jgi:hypothetical protein